ncbi:MAG: hypothetical protein AB7N61_19460 [Acidimicrobiia bacterium]
MLWRATCCAAGFLAAFTVLVGVGVQRNGWVSLLTFVGASLIGATVWTTMSRLPRTLKVDRKASAPGDPWTRDQDVMR